MAWHEILATGIILAGTAFYCWAAYSRKSGPTSCIGCGKCVADGVCILTGKKVPGISGGKGKNQGKKPVIFPLTTGQKRL